MTCSVKTVDLEVVDAGPNIVTASTGVEDVEALDILVPGAGTYYLKVFPWDTPGCNAYDLWWDDQEPALTPHGGHVAAALPPGGIRKVRRSGSCGGLLPHLLLVTLNTPAPGWKPVSHWRLEKT